MSKNFEVGDRVKIGDPKAVAGSAKRNAKRLAREVIKAYHS